MTTDPLEDGRIQCDVCPRACRLHEGRLCFVRARQNDGIVLTTYGRSSGFCVDPIEKKPRDWFTLIDWSLTPEGRCQFCGTACAGVFDGPPERWGARRMPVRLAEFPV